jgi:hypothetical protein
MLTAGGADLKVLKRLRMTPPSSRGNDQQNSKLNSKTTRFVNTRRREAAEKRLRIRIRNYGKTQLGVHEVSLDKLVEQSISLIDGMLTREKL